MHTRVRETSKFHLSTYLTTSLITSLSDILMKVMRKSSDT